MASNNALLDTESDDSEDCLPSLNNIQSVHNQSLITKVKSAKEELDDQFQRYHCMLQDKHEQMSSQLDAILTSANDLHKKRRELITTQRDLEEGIKSNQFHAMKSKMLQLLLEEFSELERNISRGENEVLELEWKHSQLESAIEESCFVIQRELIVANDSISDGNSCMWNDLEPVWSAGSRGTGAGQMKEAKGITIDSENEDIYIADRDNNRIVIYDKNGIFVRNMELETLNKPHTLIVIGEYCFVACAVPNEGLIVKVNKRTSVINALLAPGCNLTALTLDKGTALLFGCPLCIAAIWYFQQEDLEKVYELELSTANFKKGTQIHGIETREDEIFILFYNSPSPLQSFSRDGKLLRNMVIPADMLKLSLFFTVDAQHNFIFSDKKLKVFSPRGEFIAEIGKDLTDERAQGELYGPRGVAQTGNGHIVVCDGKRKNILQMF